MTKKALLNKTMNVISKLPEDKIKEVSDFADYLLMKYEGKSIQKGIEKLVSDSETFNFLKEEDEIYSENDLKEKYQ